MPDVAPDPVDAASHGLAASGRRPRPPGRPDRIPRWHGRGAPEFIRPGDRVATVRPGLRGRLFRRTTPTGSPGWVAVV